ncbi:phage holin [Priestia sp. FSL R5-0597]|uniref:phage holin n=1 Tax=Priestia sp. FSL R5-0597 TaxID=2921580 RepID=UPI0030F96F69
MNKDFVKQITAFLMAILLFLGTLNVKFEWFTVDSINAFEAVLIAAIPLVAVLVSIYKNHYGITEKAKEQKEVLKQKGLK